MWGGFKVLEAKPGWHAFYRPVVDDLFFGPVLLWRISIFGSCESCLALKGRGTAGGRWRDLNVYVTIRFKCGVHFDHFISNVIHGGGWRRWCVIIFVRYLGRVRGRLKSSDSTPPRPHEGSRLSSVRFGRKPSLQDWYGWPVPSPLLLLFRLDVQFRIERCMKTSSISLVQS